jgi:hypothetical protein
VIPEIETALQAAEVNLRTAKIELLQMLRVVGHEPAPEETLEA